MIVYIDDCYLYVDLSIACECTIRCGGLMSWAEADSRTEEIESRVESVVSVVFLLLLLLNQLTTLFILSSIEIECLFLTKRFSGI